MPPFFMVSGAGVSSTAVFAARFGAVALSESTTVLEGFQTGEVFGWKKVTVRVVTA